MAVPDWPLSFGTWMPPMVGGVFYEHGHRMVAGTAALLTLALAISAQRSGARIGLKKLAWFALGVVVLQALLGGLTVVLGTHFHWDHTSTLVSPIHATLAQFFFCLLVSIAALTAKGWMVRKPSVAKTPKSWQMLGWATVVASFIQIVLGAVIRHQGIGLIILDFPLSYGRLVPTFYDWRVVLVFAHRSFAYVVLGLTLALAFRVLIASKDRWLKTPALVLALAILLQVTLGAFSVWTMLKPQVTAAHVAGASLVLGSSLVLTLRVMRSRGGLAGV